MKAKKVEFSLPCNESNKTSHFIVINGCVVLGRVMKAKKVEFSLPCNESNKSSHFIVINGCGRETQTRKEPFAKL